MQVHDEGDSNQKQTQRRLKLTGNIQRGKSASNKKKVEFAINDCFLN